MMATINKFLEAYKKLETEIRLLNPNDTIYDYENRLSEKDSLKAEKLKVCRINRNFIQHNADGDKFVGEVSDKWVLFLEQEANAIHARNDLVKKHIYKATPITEKTTISEAIDIVTKSTIDVIPVVKDKNQFVGVITPKHVLVAYKKSGSIRKKVFDVIPIKNVGKTKKEFVFTTPSARYLDYMSKTKCIVTSDGTENGTYIGFLKGS